MQHRTTSQRLDMRKANMFPRLFGTVAIIGSRSGACQCVRGSMTGEGCRPSSSFLVEGVNEVRAQSEVDKPRRPERAEGGALHGMEMAKMLSTKGMTRGRQWVIRILDSRKALGAGVWWRSLPGSTP